MMIRVLVLWLLCINMVLGVEVFNVLNVGSSARMIGIGNIYGFSKSSDSVFENPASLTLTNQTSLSMFHTAFLNEEVKLNVFSASNRTEWGTFGFGYFSFVVDDLAHTYVLDNGDFDIKDRFAFTDTQVNMSYQNQVTRSLSYGFTFKYFSKESLDISGRGYNLDGGLFLSSDLADFSLVGRNLIPFLKMHYRGGAQERFPLGAFLSASRSFDDFVFFAQIIFF